MTSNQTSKYIRIYGLTLQEISNKTGLSIVTIHGLLNGKRRKRHAATIEKFRIFREGLHDSAHGAGDGGPASD